jgi:hypothetical protein
MGVKLARVTSRKRKGLMSAGFGLILHENLMVTATNSLRRLKYGPCCFSVELVGVKSIPRRLAPIWTTPFNGAGPRWYRACETLRPRGLVRNAEGSEQTLRATVQSRRVSRPRSTLLMAPGPRATRSRTG